MWIWRRSPTLISCRSRWPARWGCPISRAAPPWTPCCGLFATVRCWWCWTTASICSTPCAELVVALLGGAPGLTLLATSREAIGVAGELSWRVPSLSLADEAIELFADRARHARPDFTVTDDNAAAVAEICARLDGMPLAIELAAARVRALSLTEILDSLHDRFRLLTGGARTAVRRQQTLRASVDWSHALLTEPERVLFRRLAVFSAASTSTPPKQSPAAATCERYQVLDQLTLLVDKSLVVADDSGGRTRYRLLETVRQYALEKLGESGEADAVRARHRDHYTALAALLDAPAGSDYEQRIEQADIEIDNLRAAFAWSRENSDIELALALASSLQPLWQARGRLREGLAWFDAALDRPRRAPPCGGARGAGAGARRQGHARHLDGRRRQPGSGSASPGDRPRNRRPGPAGPGADRLRLYRRLLRRRAGPAVLRRGDRPGPGLGRSVEAQPDPRLRRPPRRSWRVTRSRRARPPKKDATSPRRSVTGSTRASAAGASGWHRYIRAIWPEPPHNSRELAAEAEAAHDGLCEAHSLAFQGLALAYQGDAGAARAAADAAIEAAAELGGLIAGVAYAALAVAALAAGDAATAQDAIEAAWQHVSVLPQTAAISASYVREAALAGGDLVAARRWADDAVTTATGWSCRGR